MVKMNKNHTITLTGGEQILLWLKSTYGGWRNYYEQAKNDDDVRMANRLEKFEQKHKIKFVAKDLNNIRFRCVK